MGLAPWFERVPALKGAEKPGGNVGIKAVDLQGLGCQQPVAIAIAAVESGRVGLREGADQRAHAVGVLQRELRMRKEAAYGLDGIGARGARLNGKPFVEDERLVLPALVEVREGFVAYRRLQMRQDRERGDGIGHVRC